MDGILRSQEILEIMSAAPNLFDYSNPVLFFPVRHHSPACSYHLLKAIEAYKPDCILIEGPENASGLIPVLTHEDTKPPLALYYAYRDSKGLVTEEKEDYKCYYPFLDYSPELTALKKAKELGIEARFIDLPYAEILIGTKENHGVRKEGEKQTYNDDYLLSRSKYLQLLCEKTGLRDFEELWEKYFEIGGLTEDTAVFVNHMMIYCTLSRLHTPKEAMESDGCLLREQFMAERIHQASKEYQRVLAVTGGFHTYGLMELLKAPDEMKKPKLHQISEQEQNVYPMPYSMEAADALNGYASGMQSPGFYQKVWEGLDKDGRQNGIYEDTVLYYLIQTGKTARKKEETISAYDEICALTMSRGLAALRDKREPGLYELRDSVLSSYVKGECNLSTDGPLRILKELTTGKQVGSLCADAQRPPILLDFEQLCSRYHLKIHSTVEQEVILELFTKERHLQMSRFFYQMEFLNTGFARRSKGSDLINRRDKNRIREIWKYKWSSQVIAGLIDASVSGGTLLEASTSLWNKGFLQAVGCKDGAKLLVQGFLMGLVSDTGRMRERMEVILAEDGDFFSLTEGFSHLNMLYELRGLYRIGDELGLEELIGKCFFKIIQLLPSMAGISDEQLKGCMESCLTLYQVTGKSAFSDFRPVLMESFEALLSADNIHSGLEGTIMGLLYGFGMDYGEKIRSTFSGYVRGTRENTKRTAGFLRGLFFTARDFVFASQDFLGMIDELLGLLPGNEFLELLPELRMAFAYFTPMETDRIAAKAAALHGESKKELLSGRKVSPLEYEYGEQLDAYAVRRMQEELSL